jgi:UDP-N-acetylmuramoyl-tripeptide--D-alanyl-D-alanine ligase
MNLSTLAEQTNGTLFGDDLQFNGCSIDSRVDNTGQLFIALDGERFNGHDFIEEAVEHGAVAAMVTQDITTASISNVKVNDTIEGMSMMASNWRDQFDIPLIAVTGSNGKTSVKGKIYSILSENASVLSTQGNMNNHLGVPLTLFNLDQNHQYAVIEMGANHPGEISQLTTMAKPSVALITTCAPSHLEGFGSVDGVARAKSEIFQGLSDNGVAIINADDKYAEFFEQKTRDNKQLRFSIEHKEDVYADNIIIDSETLNCSFDLHISADKQTVKLKVPGRHNVQNAVAAAACCSAIGISIERIKSGLEKFSPVKGRLQLVANHNGIKIYDDSYNANPNSLEVALQTIAQNHGENWLILGDMGELGEEAETLHRASAEKAREAGFKRIFAIGDNSKFTIQEFGQGGEHFSGLDELILSVKKELMPGVSILIKGSRSMQMERVTDVLREDA